MKRLWLVLILLAGCARKDVHPTDRVGTYAVSVRNEPSPARTGENALLVRLEDGQGMPVRGATIDAVVSMPAMGAMPYMESRGKTSETSPGSYRVTPAPTASTTPATSQPGMIGRWCGKAPRR